MSHLGEQRLHVGSGTTVGALTVFPIWVEGPAGSELDWTGRCLAVTEAPSGPRVDELVAGNTGDRPAVVLEGDLMEGGWQHRLAAAGHVLAPREEAVLSVRCVEQHRWGDGGRAHRAANRRASYRLLNAGRDGHETLSQDAVWSRVADYGRVHGASPTSSFADHVDRMRVPSVDPVEGQRGVIIGIGGRVAALETFGSSAGFAARWPGILGAAMLDAYGAQRVPTSAEAARRFLRAVAPVDVRPTGRAGLAVSVTGRHHSVALRGLRGDQTFIHLRAVDTAHPAIAA